MFPCNGVGVIVTDWIGLVWTMGNHSGQDGNGRSCFLDKPKKKTTNPRIGLLKMQNHSILIKMCSSMYELSKSSLMFLVQIIDRYLASAII